MDLLESPLEALVAFRYYSAAAGPLWAWLAAVFTAALGLWRIRVVGFGSVSRSDPLPNPAPPAAPTGAPVAERPAPVVVQPACHVEEVRSPKDRFTAYYSCDELCREDDESQHEGHDGERDDVDEGDLTAWRWDVTVVRRRGHLGWYKYQDITALNGSVVRLWDGGARALTPLAIKPSRSRSRSQHA